VYPAFDLNEAIAKATIIYNNERRSATDRQVLASHMGYSAAVDREVELCLPFVNTVL